MDTGWIKLHRSISNNDAYFNEPFCRTMAWIDLLLHANHKKQTLFIRGNIIKIQRGQLGWSEVTMARRWRWGRTKVRNFLKWLENEQQIEQQKTSVTTIITIVNYDTYQEKNNEANIRRTSDEHQTNTNKNDKNVKNEKKGGKFIPPTLEEVRAYCQEKGYLINPQKFVDRNQACGWMVGKNKMKDWKAAVRTWESNRKEWEAEKQKNESQQQIMEGW